MCDHCPWKSDAMTLELHREWIDKPCPECGEIVLFESDFLNNQKLCEYAEKVNNMSDEELAEMFPDMDLSKAPEYKKLDLLLIDGQITYGSKRWNDMKVGDPLFVLQFVSLVGFTNFYKANIVSIEVLEDGNIFECEYLDCDKQSDFNFAILKEELFQREPASGEYRWICINKDQAIRQAKVELKEMQLNVEKFRNNIKNISDEN